MNHHQSHLIRDTGIVVVSIAAAVMLAKTGTLEDIITATQGMRMVGSFVAGMLFVSVFTAAPATVALGEIAQVNSLLVTALVGGLGALAGDLVIFRFVRDRIAEDFGYILHATRSRQLAALFHAKLVRWMLPFLGAVIVASPLPDEIGVSLMGLSQLTVSRFIPLSFLLNSAGILLIGMVAQNF